MKIDIKIDLEQDTWTIATSIIEQIRQHNRDNTYEGIYSPEVLKVIKHIENFVAVEQTDCPWK